MSQGSSIYKANYNINMMFINKKKNNIQIASYHPLTQYINHLKLTEDKNNYGDNEILSKCIDTPQK